jgi:hypothetical protein
MATYFSSAAHDGKNPVAVKWVAIALWIAMLLQWILLPQDLTAAIPNSAMIPLTTLDHQSPILIMGLPYSGSLALHEYFSCKGLGSRHYCCDEDEKTTSFPCSPPGNTCGACVLKNLQSNKNVFNDCGPSVHVWSAFDVETDKGWFLPQQFALGLLHEQYPNATWILNTRQSSMIWSVSVYHWHSATRRFLHEYRIPENESSEEPKSTLKPRPNANVKASNVEDDLKRAIQRHQNNSLSRQDQKLSFLQQIYRNHTKTIQLWAKQFSSHRLVQINVDEAASSIQWKLDKIFGKIFKAENADCPWSFRSSKNEDWLDFAFPF